MAIDFPASPSNGQIYSPGTPPLSWTYDGTKWVASSAGATAYVAKTGDTMTGALTLPGAPTVPLHAATKAYVDAGNPIPLPIASGGTNAITAPLALTSLGAVAKAGDTMTGTLTAPKLAARGSGASSQIGVELRNDTGPATITNGGLWRVAVGAGGNLNVHINTAAAGDFATSTLPLTIAPATGNAQFLGSIVAAGATMTGPLVLASGNLQLSTGHTGYITRPTTADSIVLAPQTGTNLTQIALAATLVYANVDFTVFGNTQLWVSTVCGSPTGGAKGTGTINAIGVYANNTLLTSDVSLKADIEPLAAACLPLVAAVEPKSFRWREPGGEEEARGRPADFSERRHSGFLAQDLAEAEVPGIVDGKPGEGMAVDVGAMLAVLWQAVRELSAKVETLEAAK